jgi:predicted HD phosphohydrolase
MGGFGVARHEELGADHLAALGFDPRVVELVRCHVAAKRYLVGADAGYAARLSEASRQTLRHQGGPMGGDEQREFEARPQFRALLRLRTWDELAKEDGRRVDGPDAYAELLRDHLVRQ